MICQKFDSSKFFEDLIYNTQSKMNPKVLKQHKFPISSSGLSKIECSHISCGQAHVAYINNGALYTWGKAGNGRLGTEDMGVEYQSPLPVITLLQLRVNVLAVSCGATHTLTLTDFGVFGWGSSGFGQLGVPGVQQTNQPRLIESILHEEIVKVKCGQYHSLALTANGRVYSWGWGIHGQLGHGTAENLVLPKVITFLKKQNIVSISAGQGHSVVLNKHGDVYTFGCGMFGQLGTGSVSKKSLPHLVSIAEPIKLIETGYFHVIAITKTNEIYTWGCNPQALRLQAQNSRRARHHGATANSRFGSSHESTNALFNKNAFHKPAHIHASMQLSHLLPSLINSVDEEIIEISCGSHHSTLVTTTGKLFSWGRNSEGQIGNGTRKEQKYPSLVTFLKDRKIIHVSCGADFTVVLDANGKIFGWGQNDGGQIGHKPTLESNSKYNSASSSGRVITIRTNRRMITITQPCRQSILRPIEINPILYNCITPTLLDSGSYDKDYPVSFHIQKCNSNSTKQTLLQHTALNKPSYGPYSLHGALEVFHLQCDASIILNYCLKFGNFQAAAKLCALENLYDKALEYQLKAIFCVSNEKDLKLAMHVIQFYANLLDHEKVDVNLSFLNQIISVWMKNDLPVTPLESFFHSYGNIFTYPLSLLILRIDTGKVEPEIIDFLHLLSANFCITTISKFLKEIGKGNNIYNLEETSIISDTVGFFNKVQSSDILTMWDESIPQDQLWLDIMHNLQTGMVSQSSIFMTANNVDILAKSLLSEKLNFCSTLLNRQILKGLDIVVFSCGHQYTLPNFHVNVLPQFQDSMHSVFYSKPHSVKFLLSEYEESVITAACPKCVEAEISNDL